MFVKLPSAIVPCAYDDCFNISITCEPYDFAFCLFSPLDRKDTIILLKKFSTYLESLDNKEDKK